MEKTQIKAKLGTLAKVWLIVCIAVSVLALAVNVFLFHGGATHEILGGFYFFGIALAIVGGVGYAMLLGSKRLGFILSYIMLILGVVFLAFFLFGVFTDGFDSFLMDNLVSSVEKAKTSGIFVSKLIGNMEAETAVTMVKTVIIVDFAAAIVSPIITRFILAPYKDNIE